MHQVQGFSWSDLEATFISDGIDALIEKSSFEIPVFTGIYPCDECLWNHSQGKREGLSFVLCLWTIARVLWEPKGQALGSVTPRAA